MPMPSFLRGVGPVSLVLAAACGDVPLSPPSPAVTWVAGDTLDAEHLARLLVLAQPFPLEAGAAVDLARHWQLADGIAHVPDAGAFGLPPEGGADVAAFRRSRFPDAMREAEVRAALTYDAGQLRLIEHVLRRAEATAVQGERALQRRAADAILRDLRNGGAWADANRRNEDEAARADGGIIGLVAPGELPYPIDSVAFALPPGGVSGVIESAAGFHVVRRPRFEDARAEYARRLGERLADAQERTLGGEAATRRNATLIPVAALRVGELAMDPWSALGTTDPVGTFDGGVLTGGRLARALARMPWDARRGLAAAPAPEREAFAGRLLVRAALEADAIDAGFTVDPARSDSAALADLALLRARIPPTPEDPRLGVDRYLARIAARHVVMTMPDPQLWPAVLNGRQAGFDPGAVDAALERARTLLIASGYAREGT